MSKLFFIVLNILFPLSFLLAEEPQLPIGLEFPAGESQASQEKSAEPDLPTGLLLPGKDQVLNSDSEKHQIKLNGFWEARGGVRTESDPFEKQASIAESRLQIDTELEYQAVTAKITGDLVYDPVVANYPVDFEAGTGLVDLREGNLFFRLGKSFDLKIGRQILTWGTGDFLFINDLFPKDWNSFFIGRDDEYLKAPSDSIKTSWFSEYFNIDFVYSARFNSDRFISGDRISYYDSVNSQIAGRNQEVQIDDGRSARFREDEFFVRVYRQISSFELAIYGYHGFWKSPAGFSPVTGEATFPALSVYGSSLRGPLLGGIASAEVGFYDSEDDRSGRDPFVRNSELRALLGIERELWTELTGGAQYYIESMTDYGNYKATLPVTSIQKDRIRHVLTQRLTYLMYNQNLTLTLFNFVSPSDQDGYLRPKVSYKLNDSWQIDLGGNFFYGRKDETFFGQFENNSNIFVGLRYGFVSDL